MPLSLAATSLYAGLLGLWVLFLTARVILYRRSAKISLGDGASPEMSLRVRCHGNAVETVPLALILLALTEVSGAPGWVVHGLGLMLLTGRLLHGAYFFGGAKVLALRVTGMGLTEIAMGLCALGLIGHALMGDG